MNTKVLAETLKKLSGDITELADLLSAQEDTAPAEETPAAEETRSKEEVRALLISKSRAGFRAEVKALLSAHGVGKLGEITDPKELAAVFAEAEVIGNG